MRFDRGPSRFVLVLLWLIAGGVLLLAAAGPPVSRTQEARVLETAREMSERPVREWAIPTLNGVVRLRKPPLAYWMSATSFRVFGVGDWTGRLPMVGLTWATIGLTYLIARRLFDRPTALAAAAVLAGTWLFFRYGILAETDGPTEAFLTTGVYCVLRSVDAPVGRDTRWQHGVAVCLALIVLCKGPPALCLVLFAVALCGVRRQWRPVRRFFTSGAVVTLLLLAVPWFVYVAHYSADGGQLGNDLANSAEGGDHRGPPWVYGPKLLLGLLPWTPLWIAALFIAGARMSKDVTAWRANRAAAPFPVPLTDGAGHGVTASAGLWTTGLWAGVVLVPLLFWGNKQIHYLLPTVPPTAILIGWAVARSWRTAENGVTIPAAVLLAGLTLVGPAVVYEAFKLRPRPTTFDIGLGGVLIALAAATIVVWRRRGFAQAFVPLSALAMGAMFTAHAWLPPITGGSSRLTSAELVAAYPEAHFVFRTRDMAAMSWSMRRAVPEVTDEDLPRLAADSKLVVLDQQQDDEPLPAVPPGYSRVRQMRQKSNVLHVYVPLASAWRAAMPND